MTEDHKRTKPGSFICICGSRLKYNEEWDAYYCLDSMEWVEEKCEDPHCRMNCNNRPNNAPGEIERYADGMRVEYDFDSLVPRYKKAEENK